MVDFKTAKSDVRDCGTLGFVAVETKEVESRPGEVSRFLLVARGMYRRDGSAARRNFVTLPLDVEAARFVAAALLEQAGDVAGAAALRAVVA